LRERPEGTGGRRERGRKASGDDSKNADRNDSQTREEGTTEKDADFKIDIDIARERVRKVKRRRDREREMQRD
jgi:hypothetical protein